MRQLNIIILLFSILTTTIISISQSVLAKENIDNKINSKLWFIEGRFQKSFSEGVNFSDSDTTDTKIVSETGVAWDNLDSKGIAIGRFFNEGKISFSLGYEDFGTLNRKMLTATQQNGTVVPDIVLPMSMNNIIVEVGYNIPLSKNIFAVGLAGLGQASINSKLYSVNGVGGIGTAKKVNNTSSRFGVGLGYNVSNHGQIICAIQYSDYGDSQVITGDSTQIFSSEVSATEASIRYRIKF
tara:strand:- start:2446 stop:3165 length:720 start_codon:yes stop_codon:yes gene_type:complete